MIQIDIQVALVAKSCARGKVAQSPALALPRSEKRYRGKGKQVKPRHTDCLTRLSRIEGQVRGVSRMIENKRYCIDILTQLRAIRAALGKVETKVIKDHADHCIADAIGSGSEAEQKKKFSELIELFGRYTP